MKVHEILRKLRRDRDLTQQNVADELGVDITTYNRYEKDGSIIQVDMLERIAKLYEISLPELLSYGDKSILKEPELEYEKREEVTLLIRLDGKISTLEKLIKRLRKLNAAAV